MGLWKISWNTRILSLVLTRDLCWSESLVSWPPGLVSSKASSKSNCFGFTCNPRLSWIIGDVDCWWIWLGLLALSDHNIELGTCTLPRYQQVFRDWTGASQGSTSSCASSESLPEVAYPHNLGVNEGLHIICLFRTLPRSGNSLKKTNAAKFHSQGLLACRQKPPKNPAERPGKQWEVGLTWVLINRWVGCLFGVEKIVPCIPPNLPFWDISHVKIDPRSRSNQKRKTKFDYHGFLKTNCPGPARNLRLP